MNDKLIKIELTNKAKEYIISSAYNESYGARPIKRYVTKNIESLIANNILNEEISYNQNIIIDIENEQFIIKNKEVNS